MIDDERDAFLCALGALAAVVVLAVLGAAHRPCPPCPQGGPRAAPVRPAGYPPAYLPAPR